MIPLKDRFGAAASFADMLSTASVNLDLYVSVRARAHAPPEFAERIAATGRNWHLLAISEDWCGDSVNILPMVDALADSSPQLEFRIIERDRNLDVMDAHLTNGTSRAIPIVILLDDRFVERAWWGPRPRALQEWASTPEAKAMTKDERYKELRKSYARDRGRTIMDEITTMIERAAAAGGVAVTPASGDDDVQPSVSAA